MAKNTTQKKTTTSRSTTRSANKPNTFRSKLASLASSRQYTLIAGFVFILAFGTLGYQLHWFGSAAIFPLTAPTSPVITSSTSTSVNVKWGAPVGASAYRVKISRTATMDSPRYVPFTTNSGKIDDLWPGQMYYYQVAAVDPVTLDRLSDFSDIASGSTLTYSDGPVNVRIGSFNVLSVTLDKYSGEQRPWKDRRATVMDQITDEKLDVLGAQEVNQSSAFKTSLVDGTNQFMDLKNGLNKRGWAYALTNEYPNNCTVPTVSPSSSSCVYQYRGASGDNRIYYNTATVSMVSQGSYAYPTQYPGAPRNFTYAVLEMKATKDRFFFVSTHLEVASSDIRQQQWKELISKVNSLHGTLPVVAVGDFNVQKFDPVAGTMLPAMKSAGYGDVLNQQFQINPPVGIRAQTVINGWINSNNHMSRDVSTYSYAARHDKIGNNIDWIFATNSLAVKQWKTVINYDPSTMQVQGIMPSDHNMVTATITLP